MIKPIETVTPPNTPKPIGPYNHISRVGEQIWIGGTAGIDPATGELAGTDVRAQTLRILASFKTMLEAVNSDLNHVTHINIFLAEMADFIFLAEMADFEQMNVAYADAMGDHLPARTVVAVKELPKPGVRLTMNLTAVTKS